MKKKKIVTVLLTVFVVCIIGVSYVFFSTIKTYSATELPSTLVGDSAEKSISSGNAGYLTYGPYIILEAGVHEIEVHYSSTGEGHYVDICSGSGSVIHDTYSLPETETSLHIRLELDETISMAEIRTFYAGNGTLSVEKIIVYSVGERLPALFDFLTAAMILAVWGILFVLLKKKAKDTQKNYDWLHIAGLFFVAVAIRYTLADFSKLTETYGDEFLYYGIARSIFQGDGIAIRNAAVDFQKMVYSLLIAPTFAIDDGALRIKIISLINCILMTLSIVPAWLIAKELQLSRKNKYIFLCIVLIWPDMVFTMTFMSEILIWPILFAFVYLWLLNRRRRKKWIAALAGVVCYIGYMCKETMLFAFLACIVFELAYPVLEKITSKERKPWKAYFDMGALGRVGVLAGVFFACNIVVSVVAFGGTGSSYGSAIPMSIAAFFSSPYSLMYTAYGFLYFVAAILLAVMIFPIIYPIVFYRKMNEQSRNLFLFLGLYLLIGAAVIAFTITGREDLGKVVPRVHLRYVGPALVMLIPGFLHFMSNTHRVITDRNKIVFIVIFAVCAFLILSFKGIHRGSAVDQFSLHWYYAVQNRFGVLELGQEGSLTIYLYALVVGMLVLAVGGLLHYLYARGKMKVAKAAFISVFVILCVMSNISAARLITRGYSVNDELVKSIQNTNDYFADDEIDSVLYITHAGGLSSTAKAFDTYFDEIRKFYMISDSAISKEMASVDISTLNMAEPTLGRPYEQIDELQYIIVESGTMSGMQLVNVEFVPEISCDKYSVYKNLEPSTLNVAAIE